MTPRKIPGVAFWTTAAVVALAAYVLSIGPAAWFVNQNAHHEYVVTAYFIYYSPILIVYLWGPQAFRDAMDWYIALWS